jgi:hypothetical protein
LPFWAAKVELLQQHLLTILLSLAGVLEEEAAVVVVLVVVIAQRQVNQLPQGQR